MSTAPLGTASRVRTRAFRDPGRLIDLLPDAHGPLCWVRGSAGLVGWGEAARFHTRGPNRFAEADAWWRSFTSQLEVTDEVGVPGSGPVAFTSFAFAHEPDDSIMVVPEVVVGRRDGVGWITEINADGSPSVRTVVPVRTAHGVRYGDGQFPVERWRQAVTEAVRRMRRGELFKAVFAHDLLATADEPLDPRYLLLGLAQRYPSCWSFAVDGLVGATPELLLRRLGTLVSSRVLAGTKWRREDGVAGEDGPERLGAELMSSAKERTEHRYAVESLVRPLRPLCTEVHVPEVPSVLRLPNVSHLASDITATLDPDDPPSLLRLAGAVHPTAAVGGTPTEPALRLINELEQLDRGRYAGPVGWVDSRGDGELGLALRCAQLDGRTARLFGGGGVVADSDPDTEVAEVAAKLRAVRSALDGR